MSNEVTTQQAKPAVRSSIAADRRGMILNSLDEMWRFAQCVVASGLAPKGMDRPEAIVVAVQLGCEVGLTPMSAIQNIANINGRPGIYGDAALALVRDSGLLEEYAEYWELDGKVLLGADKETREPTNKELENDTCTVVVRSLRRGDKKPLTTRFSVADAKTAGLWKKAGPWMQYPKRMLKFRGRGFNLRDNYGDVLKGLRTVEELGDIPVEPTVAATPPIGRQSLRPQIAATPPAEPANAEQPINTENIPLQEGEIPNDQDIAAVVREQMGAEPVDDQLNF